MTRRDLGIATAALALLLAMTAWHLGGPSPVGKNASADRFSAARAYESLRFLLAEQVPHPVGTAANQTVRDRVRARFAALGYQTDLHRDFVCNATPTCATVENILAVRPGDTGPFVLLVSHYDSVGAGPGASDAGVAVAALLEVARALAGARGIAFLITDGEEAGLLGAEAFVKTPWKDRVSIVVNAENRGTSGPAFLFETNRGNAGLIPAMRAIDRPYASSLFYTIYDLLPNDTDVTVFKRDGLQALNFGAIGNVEYYHTPLDDLAHVDPGTLQHHGDNLLSVTRALQRGFRRTSSNAVFFTVFGFVISWPEAWTVWIALISLVLLLAFSRDVSWRMVLIGFLMVVAAFIVTALLAFGITWLAHLRAGRAEWIAFPQAVVFAMWMTGIAGTLGAFALVRRGDRRGVFAGAGLVWHVVAISLAIKLPGTSFLFLVPAVAFTIAGALRMRPLFAALLTSLAGGLVLFPVALFFYPALGRTCLIGIAVTAALVMTPIAALLERAATGPAIIIAVLAVIAGGATVFLPVYTPDHPRRQAIEHELDQPTVRTTVARSGDIATIRISSTGPADRVTLDFDQRVDVLRVNGVAPAPRNPRRSRRRGVTVYGRDAVVEARVPAGTTFTARDLTYGLPAEVRSKAAARDADNAVTSHRGDVTLSSVKGKT